MRTIKRILLAFAGLAGLFVALNLLLLVTQSSILMRQQVFEKGQPYYFVPPRQAGEVERGGWEKAKNRTKVCTYWTGFRYHQTRNWDGQYVDLPCDSYKFMLGFSSY
jgi:hypothetical protein